MARVLADLPEEDIRWLDDRAAEQGRSRASMLREAVATFKARSEGDDSDWLKAGFGLWAREGLALDPRDYDRLRRAEWTRPWDEDYEQVRAESPECFTEQDDRERAHYLRLAGRGGGTDSAPGR